MKIHMGLVVLLILAGIAIMAASVGSRWGSGAPMEADMTATAAP